MSYNSKYTGQEIEELLDKVDNIENATTLTEKDISDMGFTKNQGTVTGVAMNGEIKGGEGIVNLGTVLTDHLDISGKQDKLISGSNIKTINGKSILGSGNILIEGGNSEGSSESTQFFMNITVNEFIRLVKTYEYLDSYEDIELMNAAKSNKIICIKNNEESEGYLIAEYDYYELYYEDTEEYRKEMIMTITTNGFIYTCHLFENDYYMVDIFGISYKAIGRTHEFIHASEWASVEIYMESDNIVYLIEEPVNTILISAIDVICGSTVKFKTVEENIFDFSLQIAPNPLFANGVPPVFEPDTYYEINISFMDSNLFVTVNSFKEL